MERLQKSRDPLTDAAILGFASAPIMAASDRFEVIQCELSTVPKKLSTHGPEFVFGTPFDPKCLEGTQPRNISLADKFVRLVRDARIIGYRAVLLEDNTLYLGAPLKNPKDLLDQRNLKLGSEGFGSFFGPNGDAMIAYHNPANREIFRGRGIFLTGLEPNNFGLIYVQVASQNSINAATKP